MVYYGILRQSLARGDSLRCQFDGDRVFSGFLAVSGVFSQGTCNLQSVEGDYLRYVCSGDCIFLIFQVFRWFSGLLCAFDCYLKYSVLSD